jgi:hypothetical protein
MAEALANAIAFVGIDIGKNSFHVVGLDRSGSSYCARSGRVARWRFGLPTSALPGWHGSLCWGASSQSPGSRRLGTMLD